MTQDTSSQMATSPVTIERSLQQHTQLVPLVEATTFGSGGVQYRRLDVQSQLARFNDPVYFYAIAGHELVAAYVLDKRDLLICDKSVNGYYRGVLTVKSDFQGSGIGKRLTNTAMQWMRSQASESPVVSYGCIDQSNFRSMKLLQSTGATSVASLSMFMMYRQWPSVVCELDDLHASDVDELHAIAQHAYADCKIRDVTASRLPAKVLKDAKGIAVCARVGETRFQLSSMGRMAELSIRFLVKPFAVARKRFDPNCFRYISFNEVMIRPGCEALWPDFVSTVLAQNHIHFGAVYVDPRSQLFEQLRKAQPLTRILHSRTGSIHVVWQTFQPANLQTLALPGAHESVHVWPVDA